ncbi:MAG: DUF11 domain-containing protein, partial [Chloroflexota bacterium]|nr:DUF11 domain-containing protein [Chloroflexota bacterium]
IPSSTTFQSVTYPANWACTTPGLGGTGVVSCTPNGGGSLAANHSATFALVVLADQGVLTGTVLSAASTAGSQTTDPIAANNTATATADATTSADLGVTSSLAPSPAVAGQTLIDTVTVTNTGPSAAAAPVVTTTIPAGTTFQGVTHPGDWTCTTPNGGGTGTVLCTPNSGRLAAGASAQFVLTLGVPASVPNNSSIGVTTTTGSQTNDPNQTNNASTATVTVATVADLTVSDAASSPVVAGQDVTYTTTLVNNGPSDAPNVVVTATVPAGTTFGSFTASGWTCGQPNASGVVTCTAATLPAGQSVSFPLVVHAAASVPATVTLRSDTGAANAYDPDTSNNTAHADAQVSSVADLAVTFAAAPNPVAGQNVTYTAALTNTGPSNAAGAVFTATIPAGATFQSATASTGWACTPTTPGSASVVSCQPNGGSLAAGAHATVAFQLAIAPSASLDATLDSTATVSSASGDSTLADNSVMTTAAVTTSADLYVTGVTAVPNPATAGQDVTYATTFGNYGPSDATGAVLTMTVPAGTTFVSADGGIFSCNAPAQGRVVCTAASLPAASTGVAHLTVAIPSSATTPLASQSTLTSGTSDPDPTNNSGLGSAGVQTAADLSVGMTFSPHPVVAGQDITYTTTLHNAGPSDAATPVVTTTVPVSTTFVSLAANGWNCTTPPVGSGGVVSCTPSGGGSLAASDSATFALTVLADQGVFTGTVLTATSTVGSPTTDPIATNNTANANANATTSADLGVTSSLTPNGAVVAGQTLTDTVTVTNHGPSAAAAPVVTTTVRAGTTFQGLTSPGDWACTTPPLDGVGAVSCTPNDGRLAAGASAQFVLTLGVPANVSNRTNIGVTTTTGSRDGQTNDPNQTNNASTDTVNVATVSDLAVSDTASPNPVAGQDATYTTTLVNTGPSDASNPVVTATIPAGTTFGSFSANGWTCGGPNASGVVTCTAATLPAGQSVSFPLVVRVSPDVTNGVTLTSATGASTTTTDPNLSNNTARAGARVTTRADLQVTNVVVPTPILPG